MNLIKFGNILEILIILLISIKSILYDIMDFYNNVHQLWQEIELWIVITMLLWVIVNVCYKLWRIKDED